MPEKRAINRGNNRFPLSSLKNNDYIHIFRKNVSAVAYDITSLAYKQDVSGVGQKYVDDMGEY